MKHLAYIAMLVVGLFITGCEDSNDPSKTSTYKGAVKNIGNGTAQSWVTMNEAGEPTSYGVTLSANALTGLPQAEPGTEFMLPMPAEAALTGINHISLDYNPHGHEPENVYTVEHFDVHFYMIDSAKRNQITPGMDTVPVAAQYIPVDYFCPAPMAVPRMGVHYIDSKAGELHGHDFDQTFIYGYWRGEMVFMEPMLTMDFLKNTTTFTTPLKQPQAWQKTGHYYPTSYGVRRNPSTGDIVIEMTGLTKR